MKKLASVIIPAHNEERLIKKGLISLKKQSRRPLEIIVVNNGSSDQTQKIAERYADRVIYIPQRGSALARNVGAKVARGEYLFFLDADTKLSENAIERGCSLLEKGYAGGTAKVVYETKKRRIKLLEAIQNFCLERWGTFETPFFYTKKDIFEGSGGLREGIEFGENIDFLKRISKAGKLRYDPQIHALTSPRRFIRNKDYLYAIVGGFFAMAGVRSIPFYPVRNVEELEIKNGGIKRLLNKEMSLPPMGLKFIINTINKKRVRIIFEKYRKILGNFR